MTRHAKGQFSFFNIEERLEKIHELNSFLPRLHALVNWETFRYQLNKVREKERLSNAGRPPFDVMTELMIRDRISFMEFLGLTVAHRVPPLASRL